MSNHLVVTLILLNIFIAFNSKELKNYKHFNILVNLLGVMETLFIIWILYNNKEPFISNFIDTIKNKIIEIFLYIYNIFPRKLIL